MQRLIVVFLLLAASCGDSAVSTQETAAEQPGSADVIVIRASTDLAVGTERVLLALAATDGSRLGSPELAVTVAAWPEDDPSARQEVAGSWIWAVPDRSGLYRVTFDFDQAGIWLAQVEPAEGPWPAPVPLLVQEQSSTPAIGAMAPPSLSPTASDENSISAISTDTDPDPRLYSTSIDDAVTSGRPTVIAFATPQFCQTAICGPTLEVIKDLVDGFPEVNFIHVEVFDLAASPPNPTSIEELVLAPAVLEWGLTSEPWVFVVDETGVVSGRFEGVVDSSEIAALLG